MEDLPQQILEYTRTGFDEVNAVQGLLIAAVATLLMPSWKRLIVFTIGAVIAHVLVDTLLPVLQNDADLLLPPVLEGSFWRYVFILFVGYLVVITILGVIKKLLLRS